MQPRRFESGSSSAATVVRICAGPTSPATQNRERQRTVCVAENGIQADSKKTRRAQRSEHIWAWFESAPAHWRYPLSVSPDSSQPFYGAACMTVAPWPSIDNSTTCGHCGAYISDRFCRVYGDNDDRAHRYAECDSYRRQTRRSDGSANSGTEVRSVRVENPDTEQMCELLYGIRTQLVVLVVLGASESTWSYSVNDNKSARSWQQCPVTEREDGDSR